jgi:hypothetical protein
MLKAGASTSTTTTAAAPNPARGQRESWEGLRKGAGKEAGAESQRLRKGGLSAGVALLLTEMLWWRAAVITPVLGLGVTLTIAWGWGAAVVYAFFVIVAACYAAFITLWGQIARRSGGWYYERQLRGPDHHHP